VPCGFSSTITKQTEAENTAATINQGEEFMKTKTITLSGGFHDSGEIRIKVPADFHPAIHSIQEAVSESTRKRLDRHFCGIRGCTCGGVQRATVD